MVYDEEIIIFFSDAHEHFEMHGKKDEWIIDAVYFISQILSGKFEIHFFYKGNKVIKTRTYIIDSIGEKEFLSSCSYLTPGLLKPFAKVREKIEREWFFENDNESL